MPRHVTRATSVHTLKKEAKRWLRAIRAGNRDADARLRAAYPSAPAAPALRDVQHALAREYGHQNWLTLRQAVDSARATESTSALLTADAYERLAHDVVRALDARDEAALERLNRHYARAFTFDDLAAEIWRRVYGFRQRASRERTNYLDVDEAQTLIAQDAGFGSWDALVHASSTGASPVPPFFIDRRARRVGARRHLTPNEWDDLLGAMRQHQMTALDASGVMSDVVLARTASLEHVVTLSLAGSRQVSDEGLQTLARMPQLQHLDLTGTKVTDRGLEVLRQLPNLRSFELTWNRQITDAGASHLRHCDLLERVNLMGTACGDGVLEALQGKARLRQLETGQTVTDAGLAFLRYYPLFRDLRPAGATVSHDSNIGAHLMIDGPFTDKGVATLGGLAGLTHLDLFWHVTEITSHAFASLVALPNLASLGADGKLSDDEALRHMAAMPRLRTLRAQEAIATDAGFEALSRSGTLESFWGRECPNFGNRGFTAFSRMPSLRSLGVGCQNVDDDVLARFPHFPALRELTPIGVRDAGFRHIGRCAQLERLTCMYCRDTSDIATEHVAALPLRYYYAGLTQITDRSLEILGGMPSLEQVEFYECRRITDAGLVFLARLPRLRDVAVDSSPGVTLEGTRVFSPLVQVRYST